jgi:hypothetical protein
MDVIKYATFCAAAVASVTACGGGVSHDAAPTGPSVAPSATSESASPCSSATPSIVLFHADGGGWRAVQWGSGFNCTDEGVPPSIAAELEC